MDGQLPRPPESLNFELVLDDCKLSEPSTESCGKFQASRVRNCACPGIHRISVIVDTLNVQVASRSIVENQRKIEHVQKMGQEIEVSMESANKEIVSLDGTLCFELLASLDREKIELLDRRAILSMLPSRECSRESMFEESEGDIRMHENYCVSRLMVIESLLESNREKIAYRRGLDVRKTKLIEKLALNALEYRNTVDVVLAYKEYIRLAKYLPTYVDYLVRHTTHMEQDILGNCSQYFKIQADLSLEGLIAGFVTSSIVDLFSTNRGEGSFSKLISVCNMHHQRKLLSRSSGLFAEWNKNELGGMVCMFSRSYMRLPGFISHSCPWTGSIM